MNGDEMLVIELSPPLGPEALKGIGCVGTDCTVKTTHLLEVRGEAAGGESTFYPTCLDCYARMLELTGGGA